MALLEISSLGKSYDKAKILTGIDLTVEWSKVLGLIGPTCSGTTTLLCLVNLLDESSTGSILFDCREVSRRPEREKLAERRKMAMVLSKADHVQGQRGGERLLWSEDGVREDAEGIEDRAKEALAVVGLSSMGAAMPISCLEGRRRELPWPGL